MLHKIVLVAVLSGMAIGGFKGCPFLGGGRNITSNTPTAR
jgi:hypothetical protein